MIGADGVLALARPVRDEDGVWRLGVRREVALGPPDAKHASGGATHACAIAALEVATSRPLVQASASFVRAPSVGERISIEISMAQEGRAISIARAHVVGDRGVVADVQASLGVRESELAHQWLECGAASEPESCPRIPFVRADPGDLHTQLDMRLISDAATHARGRMAFWVKAPEQQPLGAAFLAIVADYLPEAIHLAINRRAGAVSLDNTLRVVRLAPTDWLRCETQLAGIRGGHFHGAMSIFTREGALLATAAQSGVVRLF